MSGSVKHVSVPSDCGWEDDNRWFDAHSGRRYRLRRMLHGELSGAAFLGIKEAEALRTGGPVLVLVAVLDADNRLRMPFKPPRGSPLPRNFDVATDEQLSRMFGIGDTIARLRSHRKNTRR